MAMAVIVTVHKMHGCILRVTWGISSSLPKPPLP